MIKRKRRITWRFYSFPISWDNLSDWSKHLPVPGVQLGIREEKFSGVVMPDSFENLGSRGHARACGI